MHARLRPAPRRSGLRFQVDGRLAALVLVPLLALSLYGQWGRATARLEASALVWRVEQVTIGAAAAGRLDRAAFSANLRALRRAGELDPGNVRVPMNRGAQYMLLGRHQAAAEAYREALALEPRPEAHLNLGRALYAMGREEEATEMFLRAVRLSRPLVRDLPEPVRTRVLEARRRSS